MYYLGTLACLFHGETHYYQTISEYPYITIKSRNLTAIRRGGRWPFIFLAPIGHGLFVEVISYNFPDIDSFWHSQSMIMLIGKRLPLHILFVCEYSNL